MKIECGWPTSLYAETFPVEFLAHVSFHGPGEAEVLIRGRRLSNDGDEEMVQSGG